LICFHPRRAFSLEANIVRDMFLPAGVGLSHQPTAWAARVNQPRIARRRQDHPTDSTNFLYYG
jgi:hypothetical protein